MSIQPSGDECSKKLKAQVIEQLKATNCVKYGEFKLKSGLTSPVYVQLRFIPKYPIILRNIVELVRSIIPKINQFDDWTPSSEEEIPPVGLIGVPYGAVQVAQAVAFACKLPCYPLSKETKDYGVKLDSGSYPSDHEYVIVEDVISTGSSIIETMKKLEGRKVTDVIAIVDRQLGGMDKLKTMYPQTNFHSILTIKEILGDAEEPKSS